MIGERRFLLKFCGICMFDYIISVSWTTIVYFDRTYTVIKSKYTDMQRLRAVPKGNDLMKGGTADSSGKNERRPSSHNAKFPAVKIDVSARKIM